MHFWWSLVYRSYTSVYIHIEYHKEFIYLIDCPNAFSVTSRYHCIIYSSHCGARGSDTYCCSACYLNMFEHNWTTLSFDVPRCSQMFLDVGARPDPGRKLRVSSNKLVLLFVAIGPHIVILPCPDSRVDAFETPPTKVMATFAAIAVINGLLLLLLGFLPHMDCWGLRFTLWFVDFKLTILQTSAIMRILYE